MEILFELLFELIAQLVFELLAMAGVEKVGSRKQRREFHVVWAMLAYALLGFLIGLLSVYIFPVSQASVLYKQIIMITLTTLAAGVLMYYYGHYKRSKGKPTTRLATFWGGAVFAFALAITRAFIQL